MDTLKCEASHVLTLPYLRNGKFSPFDLMAPRQEISDARIYVCVDRSICHQRRTGGEVPGPASRNLSQQIAHFFQRFHIAGLRSV